MPSLKTASSPRLIGDKFFSTECKIRSAGATNIGQPRRETLMTDWKELVDKCAPWSSLFRGESWVIRRMLKTTFKMCSWKRAAFTSEQRYVIGEGSCGGLPPWGRWPNGGSAVTMPLWPRFRRSTRRPSPDQAAIRREEEANLRDAVARLPEREGAAFVLRYFENLELPEIARCLGISYSAAGVALCRARAKLTHLFAETGMDETDDCQKKGKELPVSSGGT